MTDTQILNWVEKHIKTFDESAPGVFTLTYLDKLGYTFTITGCNLRDCVLGVHAEKKS